MIFSFQESIIKLSQSRSLVFYFEARDASVMIKELTKEIFWIISGLLFELSLKSFDKAISNEEDNDSDDDQSEVVSKGIAMQTPFPDDIYDWPLDFLTFGYIPFEKANKTQLQIQNLYKFTERYSKKVKEEKEYKKVRILFWFFGL